MHEMRHDSKGDDGHVRRLHHVALLSLAQSGPLNNPIPGSTYYEFAGDFERIQNRVEVIQRPLY